MTENNGLIAPGRYTGTIVGHDLSKIGQKGNPCIVFDVEVQHNGVNPTETVIFWLTEKAVPIAVRTLRTLGFTDPDITELRGSNENAGLIGQTVSMVCKHSPDNEGNMRVRWNMYPQKNYREQVDDDSLNGVAKLFRKEQESAYAQEENSNEDSEILGEVVSTKVEKAQPQKATQGGKTASKVGQRAQTRMTRDVPF